MLHTAYASYRPGLNYLPMQSAVLCVHCGAGCGSLIVEGDGQPFCCTGCKTVYGILQHAGLGSFYRLENFPGVRPQEREQKSLEEYAFLDADDVKSRLLDFSMNLVVGRCK